MAGTAFHWPVSTALARLLLPVIIAVMAGSAFDDFRAVAGAQVLTFQQWASSAGGPESDYLRGR